tara:strand:- start:247 stop:759 length:513 start_codon:yes stop_codon:yes gene_type:complete
MSTLSVDTIQGKTTAGTVAMPAGHIVQAVSFDRAGSLSPNDTASMFATLSSSTFVDIMSKAITTKLTNSKIFVSINVISYNGSGTLRVKTKVLRDSTQIDGDQYGIYANQGVMHPYVFSAIDSPSASAGTTITYKLQCARTSGASTSHGIGYADSSGASTANITLMEIAP